jgi:uncharacterized membrane protein YtjA (UPF0391 family)
MLRSSVLTIRAGAFRLPGPELVRGGAENFSPNVRSPRREFDMLYYALVFLAVGLIAGALHLAGVAAVAVQISWILLLIGSVLLVIHLVSRRTVRVSRSIRFSIAESQ